MSDVENQDLDQTPDASDYESLKKSYGDDNDSFTSTEEDEGDSSGHVAGDDEADEQENKSSGDEESEQDDNREDDISEKRNGKEEKEQVKKTSGEADSYRKALKEERARRQEAQRQLEELRQKSEKLQSTFEKIIEKANEKPKPTYEDDPIGALKNELDETKKETEALKQDREMTAKERESQEKFNNFLRDYTSQVDEFAAKSPDFDNAYRFLIDSRYNELIAAGYSKEEAKIEVQQEEARIAHKAMIDEVNPGERLYNIAKVRGYQPKNAKSDDGSNDKQASAKEKARQIERGVNASHNIGQGGAHPTGKLTLETIASMTDDEFSKFDWKQLAKVMV